MSVDTFLYLGVVNIACCIRIRIELVLPKEKPFNQIAFIIILYYVCRCCRFTFIIFLELSYTQLLLLDLIPKINTELGPAHFNIKLILSDIA